MLTWVEQHRDGVSFALHFIVETMDAMDHETIRLLATDVIPAIGMAGGQRR